MTLVQFFSRINASQGLALLLALLAGAMISLSLAPFNLWPLAIAALTLFTLLLKHQHQTIILWRSLAFGIGLYGAGVHWIYVSIHNFGGAGPVFAAFLTSVFASFMAVIFCIPFYCYGRWFSRRLSVVALPACWLLGEWLRTWLLTGFPWLFVGYGHVNTWLAGWGPVVGVLGIGWVLVFTACVIAEWIDRWPHANRISRGGLISITGICIAMWAGGAALKPVVWAKPSTEAINVGMVQPNIDQNIKLRWTEETVNLALEQLSSMSESLWHNDWVIWPEAAIPTELTYHSALPFLEPMNTKAAQHNAALFTGVIYSDADRGLFYNSVVGLGAGLGFYHKRRLVPFGEYVPLENYLRGFIEFFNLPTSYIHLGPSQQHGLIAKGVRITPAICYEIVYPDLIAQSAKETQVLLSVNNLGWFLDSIQSKQFLQMAQMRALETGRYLVYSTNNGPSAIIDNKGAILKKSDSFAAQTFSGTIYPVTGWTPFMAIGSWPLALIALLLLVGLKLLHREASTQIPKFESKNQGVNKDLSQ